MRRVKRPSPCLDLLPRSARVTLRVVKLHRSVGGAVAGGVAANVWAAQTPLDKRLFECDYDDVELLGKLVTRGDAWPAAGLALHTVNGAAFGAGYSQLRPFVPAPPGVAGPLARPGGDPPALPPGGVAAPPP